MVKIWGVSILRFSILSMRGKDFSRRHFQIYILFFQKKIGFGILCKLSHLETFCMKCQSPFSGEKKKSKIS